ncbi:MAG: hypothetical protein JW953_15995 [Anaerolineae bacterium]|nr:hypothetical protein [Anaerolineae bacterium]
MRYLNNKICFLMIMIWVAMAVGGCGSRAGQDIPAETTIEAQAAPTATPQPSPTLLKEMIEPISPVSPLSPVPPAMAFEKVEPIKGSETALAAAIDHLAQHAGVPPAKITLVSMEERQWSDASLGCPQEGFMYAQVITPGYLIVLETQGRQYEYHTDTTDNVVLCEE